MPRQAKTTPPLRLRRRVYNIKADLRSDLSRAELELSLYRAAAKLISNFIRDKSNLARKLQALIAKQPDARRPTADIKWPQKLGQQKKSRTTPNSPPEQTA